MASHAGEHEPSGVLELSDEQRKALGLEAAEHLRMVHAGRSAVLLERIGGAESSGLPWDRDLVLSADVRAFPLADVLRMAHSAGKSGYLLFSDCAVEKAVYLNRGEVVFATSNQSVDRIGDCLLRSGAIGLDQLREAERRWAPPQRFGKVLVEQGVLTPRELWNGVKLQVEEIVRSLFSHTTGCIHFWEGTVQPDNVVRLSLPTRRLVAEGLERRDELLKALADFEDPRVRFERPEGVPDRGRSSTERMLLAALDHESSFAGLCRRVGIDRLSGARTVQLLSLVGAVVVHRDEGDAAARVRLEHGSEAAVRRCVVDHVRVIGELTAPLVALEGADSVGRRFNQVIEESAQRHPELLGGLRLGAGATLDPEELAARALRLPRDRERAATSALGELLAYAEFELKNSPHIDEPDRFLEVVGELRTELDV